MYVEVRTTFGIRFFLLLPLDWWQEPLPMGCLFSPWAIVSKHTPSDLFLPPRLHHSFFAYVCVWFIWACVWVECVYVYACPHARTAMLLCVSVYMFVGSHGVQMHKILELQAGHHACLAFMFIWVLGIQMLVLILEWQVLIHWIPAPRPYNPLKQHN